MIAGIVTEDGVPLIVPRLADEDWRTVVDTGFNGALELPAALSSRLVLESAGFITSVLAAGVTVEEEAFRTFIEFDGERIEVDVTFADVEQALLGTWLLANHRLEIDFPKATVRLTRATDSGSTHP